MKIFISHTSGDKPIAEQIGEYLLRSGVDVWLDKWEMYPGDSLYDRIEQGMQEVSAFLVLITAASKESSWVRDEVKIALTRRRRDPTFRIVPILLEDVPPPLFLADLIYLNWDGGDEALEAILRALKKVTLKPPALLEASGSGVEYQQVACRVAFFGERGCRAEFIEEYRAIAASEVIRVDRSITFAGRLLDVSCDLMTLERDVINPHLEKWTLVPPSPFPQGTEFSYRVRYEIEGGFSDDHEMWFYAIEAPTDRIWVEYDFSNTTAVRQFEVLHRVGQTSYPEPSRPTRRGGSIVWEKLFPVYKDTYEFAFDWDD